VGSMALLEGELRVPHSGVEGLHHAGPRELVRLLCLRQLALQDTAAVCSMSVRCVYGGPEYRDAEDTGAE
jgi:hypothetical protein